MNRHSQVLVESNPLVFPLSSTTLSFETQGGGCIPTLARPRYENRRARARAKLYNVQETSKSSIAFYSAFGTGRPSENWNCRLCLLT